MQGGLIQGGINAGTISLISEEVVYMLSMKSFVNLQSFIDEMIFSWCDLALGHAFV